MLRAMRLTRSQIEAMKGVSIRLRDYTIVEAFNGAFKLFLDNNDTLVAPSIIGTGGFYESWLTSVVSRHVDENSVFIDFGANAGYYSMLAHWLGAAQVFVVEPNPVLVPLLTRAIEENSGGDDRFVLIDRAFTDHVGTANLYFAEDNLNGTLDDNGTPGTVVALDTVDRYFGSYDQQHRLRGPHFWKIDVEAAEERLLRGAEATMERFRPTIMAEWSPQAYSSDFVEWLSDYGDVRLVNIHGTSSPSVTQDYLDAQRDWTTILVTPH